MEFEKLKEEQRLLEEGCHILESPINDYNLAFRNAMLGIVGAYYSIHKDIEYYKSILADRILDRDTSIRIGKTLDDIQNLWDGFGSIIATARPYVSPNCGTKYKEMNETIPENLIEDILETVNILFVNKNETYLLDNEFDKIFSNIMNYKRSCFKYSQLKSVNSEDKSDLWWEFETYLNTTIDKYEVYNNNEETKPSLYLYNIIKNLRDQFDIYSDSKATFENFCINTKLIEFTTLLLSKSLYIYYNKLCNEIFEVFEEIKTKREESKLFIDECFEEIPMQ